MFSIHDLANMGPIPKPYTCVVKILGVRKVPMIAFLESQRTAEIKKCVPMHHPMIRRYAIFPRLGRKSIVERKIRRCTM